MTENADSNHKPRPDPSDPSGSADASIVQPHPPPTPHQPADRRKRSNLCRRRNRRDPTRPDRQTRLAFNLICHPTPRQSADRRKRSNLCRRPDCDFSDPLDAGEQLPTYPPFRRSRSPSGFPPGIHRRHVSLPDVDFATEQ